MRVCLFDIDGTLINSGDAGQAAMESGLATAFGVSRPVEGISTAGRTDRAIIEDLIDFHGLPVDEVTFGKVSAAYLEQLPASLERLDGLTLPGIGDLLDELSARDDLVLGLLTGNLVE
ncbi:MAG: haloacid dehalogenase, partial [Planctomycetota bacterium]|nr:haloacid dehalogenase [Planctomycetota bacterium]